MSELCKNCGHPIRKYLNWSILGKTYRKVIWWHKAHWLLGPGIDTIVCKRACDCQKPEPFPVVSD